MRKYDQRNKKNIGIIIGICLIVVIIFSYFLIKEIKLSKLKYELESNTILFDIDKNTILLKEMATIKKKWNNKYYLTYQKENYQIGTHVIAFNNSSTSLSLYGEFYEVTKNSKVNITDEETKLNNLSITRFYKVADRKYLIVDSNITTEDKSLKTENYLIIELDKLGNAILYNNSLNLKTFSETKIVTSNYTFDIANELLVYEDETIDLKKILGTTNQYKKEDQTTTDDKEENKENPSDSTNNNGSTSGTNETPNNPTTNTPPSNTTTNQDNITNNNETGTNISNSEIINQTASTSIIKITPNIKTIDIDYVIYDKTGEYLTTFIDVKSDSNINRVQLSKSTTNAQIVNLAPGTTYTLSFRYTHMDNNVLKEEEIANYTVTTLLPDIELNVNKITNKVINYNISIPSSYSITNAKLVLYIDDVKQSREIAINSSNMSGSFPINDLIQDNSTLITLSLENIHIDGTKVDKKVTYTYKRNIKSNTQEKGEENNDQ